MIRLINNLAVTSLFVLGVDSQLALAADCPSVHLLVAGADTAVLLDGAITSHPADLIAEAVEWFRTGGLRQTQVRYVDENGVVNEIPGYGSSVMTREAVVECTGGGAEEIEALRQWSKEMGYEDRPVVEAERAPLEPLLRLPAKSDRASRRSYRLNPLALLQSLCHVREQE